MLVSVWYPADQNPEHKGYYIAHKGGSMGDDETGIGLYYWNGKEWATGKWASSHYVRVTTWCDADLDKLPHEHVLKITRPKISVTEQFALDELLDALERYHVVRKLCR